MESLKEYFVTIKKDTKDYIRLKEHFDSMSSEYMNKKSCLDTLQSLAKENETEHINSLYTSLQEENTNLILRKKELDSARMTLNGKHAEVKEMMREMVENYSMMNRVLFQPMCSEEDNDNVLMDMAKYIYPDTNRDLRRHPNNIIQSGMTSSNCSIPEAYDDSSKVPCELTWNSN